MPLKECPNKHLFNATKHGNVCPVCKTQCSEFNSDVSEEELLERLRLDEGQYVCGWLICTEGVNKGRSYPLHSGKNFIGSGDGMDVLISGDKKINAYRHGSITFDSKKLEAMIMPGESSGLVYLEDVAVYSPMPLKSYVRIELGETTLMYVSFCGPSFSWGDS